ncbi:caltractin-like [Coccinella septempunctata]|uniref:caltractin-like n=1 Tax=Coccinella septempunctata TaxID=41139 RepID=UPI001D095725|nr:caltractin-like [Coccinella septempunctata]
MSEIVVSFEKTKSQTITDSKEDTSISKDRDKKKLEPKFLLSKQQKDDIKEAFDLFDSVGGGLVERDFLKVAFRALGIEPSRKDIRNLSALPLYLSYEEFVEQLQIKMTSEDEPSDVMKMFQIFDLNRSGRITYKELKKVADTLEEDVTDEELIEMLEEGDVSGDRKVEFAEFKTLLQRTLIV